MEKVVSPQKLLEKQRGGNQGTFYFMNKVECPLVITDPSVYRSVTER
jgi:hypothetical protein